MRHRNIMMTHQGMYFKFNVAARKIDIGSSGLDEDITDSNTGAVAGDRTSS